MFLPVRFTGSLLRPHIFHISLRTIINLPQLEPKLTIADIKGNLAKMLGVRVTYNPPGDVTRKHLEDLNSMLPTSQEELPPRIMKDSYDVAIIPLSSDTILQDKYAATRGTIRIGRLLEDIDIFAVWIVMKHIKNPKQVEGKPSPYGIVTGRVDRIVIPKDYVAAKPTSDIRVAGYVSWVGKTSTEVVIWLEQERDGEWKSICKAYFLMMARDRTNSKAVPINPLNPDGPDEEKQYERGLARMQARKQDEEVSLLTTEPDAEEQTLIHKMFVSSIDPKDKTLSKRILPPGSIWMSDTRLSNYVFPHPEDRNIHHTIFGGFIMRMMLELAWMVALYHCKEKVKVVQISDAQFRRPIFIGNLVRMTGLVVYTEENFLQVAAFSEVEDLTKDTTFTSNLMSYTLLASAPVKKVVPESYQEAVIMLAGRRQFLKIKEKDEF